MNYEISVEKARRLMTEAPAWLKEELTEYFGKEALAERSYEKLSTFDDCCRKCGTTWEEFEQKWAAIPVCKQVVALERLAVISEAINEGWLPNHFNTEEKKWAPYFTVLSPGFGFSVSSCHYVSTNSLVGSRLCFSDKERSDFAGKQFTKYFQDFITGK